jgi:hypothetical protein
VPLNKPSYISLHNLFQNFIEDRQQVDWTSRVLGNKEEKKEASLETLSQNPMDRAGCDYQTFWRT